MNKQLLCVCLLGMVALAAAVDAEPQKKYYKKDEYEKKYEREYKHDDDGENFHITLYVVPGTTQQWPSDTVEQSAALGDTCGFGSRGLSLTEGGPKIGVLQQSGVYVEVASVAKLANYQISITLEETAKFPAGEIVIVGDGTGVADPTYLPKAVVGGTGPYTGVTGVLTRTPPGPYRITLFNFRHKGYGY